MGVGRRESDEQGRPLASSRTCVSRPVCGPPSTKGDRLRDLPQPVRSNPTPHTVPLGPAGDVVAHPGERQRRLVIGAQARSLGYGGIRLVAAAAGVRARPRSTVVEYPQQHEQPNRRTDYPTGALQDRVTSSCRLDSVFAHSVDRATRDRKQCRNERMNSFRYNQGLLGDPPKSSEAREVILQSCEPALHGSW